MRQTIVQSHLINYYQLTAVNSGHRGLPGVWASRLLHLLANPTSCAALTNEKKHIRKILLCVKRSGKLPIVLQCEYEWAEVTHDCIYCKVPGSCFFLHGFLYIYRGTNPENPILYWQKITRTLIYSWELFAFELQGIKSYVKVLFCVLIYSYLLRQTNIFPDIRELTQNNQGTRVGMWCLRVLIINNISRHLLCDWKHRRKGCSDTLKCTLQGKPFCVLYFFSKQHMHEYTQTYVTRVLVLLLSLFLAQHPHIHLVPRVPLWPRTCRNTHTFPQAPSTNFHTTAHWHSKHDTKALQRHLPVSHPCHPKALLGEQFM